jgi:hypothetical protein
MLRIQSLLHLTLLVTSLREQVRQNARCAVLDLGSSNLRVLCRHRLFWRRAHISSILFGAATRTSKKLFRLAEGLCLLVWNGILIDVTPGHIILERINPVVLRCCGTAERQGGLAGGLELNGKWTRLTLHL